MEIKKETMPQINVNSNKNIKNSKLLSHYISTNHTKHKYL
jgi:hypothetical protein